MFILRILIIISGKLYSQLRLIRHSQNSDFYVRINWGAEYILT